MHVGERVHHAVLGYVDGGEDGVLPLANVDVVVTLDLYEHMTDVVRSLLVQLNLGSDDVQAIVVANRLDQVFFDVSAQLVAERDVTSSEVDVQMAPPTGDVASYTAVAKGDCVVEPELHYADERHAIGNVGIVFVNVIRHPSTVEMIRETRRHVQRHFRRWNGRSVAVSVLEPTAAQAVPKQVRDESAALAGEFKSLAAAIVIEGSGFRAAAVRTAIASMFLLARPPFPHKVFGNLSDGAGWVLTTGGRLEPVGASSEDIVRAVALVRGALKL